jgi:flavodoxin
MKQILIIAFLSLAVHRGYAQQKTNNMLTPSERKKAIQLLKQTEAGVFDAVKGLSEAQLNFKAAQDKWSVAECIKHIAAAEKEFRVMVDSALTLSANPEKRAEIKFSDDDLIKAVEDRTHKSKTFAALEPANSSYKTLSDALLSFKTGREKLIALVGNTKVDLRNHVVVLPIGTYDSYQFVLLIAAHSYRHTQQIEEVKSNTNFPK